MEDEASACDDESIMSISSDEGKTKVIQVIENKGKGGKKAAGKSKDKKKDLTDEEKKAIKENNAKVAKLAKKCIASLEPVIKAANKASKFDHAGEDLKKTLDAAKTLVRSSKKIEAKYKSKTWDELDIQMTDDGLKDLKTSLDEKVKAVMQVEAWVKGGLDGKQLDKLNEMAKKREEDRQNAKDVS